MCVTLPWGRKHLLPKPRLWHHRGMRLRTFAKGFFLAVAMFHWAAAGQAQTVRTACLQSERGGGQGRLCRCIQAAADKTLSLRDQRTVARFFRDPEEAQRMRRSDRRRDEDFWERYERFGEFARKSCRR